MYLDPFNKSLDSISVADIERLRDVSEGWYVEYKREAIHPRAVGKSLSAFANHFGGWLIFGVDAPDRTPRAFPGLTPAQVSSVMNSLREAIRAHINPVVVYETREVMGPLDSIGLPAERAVVIVLVRQGRNPPYIHSSGRIYRRVDDASDPKAETDRAVIDQLTQRANEYRENFRKSLERLPEMSKNESKMPFLQIFLTTDPWQERKIEHVLNHSEFAEIMGRKDDGSYSIALENSFPNEFGFTARHVGNNDPFNMLYTWKFSHHGISSVVVPLMTLDEHRATPYKYSGEFFRMLPESLRTRVIDATSLWLFLSAIIAKQDALAKSIGVEGNLFIKFRFLNLWRLVPYIDTETFMASVRSHGIPVVQQSEQITPPGLTPDDMLEIKLLNEKLNDPKFESLIRAATMLDWALNAVGASHKSVTEKSELEKISELFARAIRVQTTSV